MQRITFKEFIELYYKLTKDLTYVKAVSNETNKMRSADLREAYAGMITRKTNLGMDKWLKNKLGTEWKKRQKELTLPYYFINDKNEVDISFHSKRTWCLNNYKEVKYKKAEIEALFKCYENGEITYKVDGIKVYFELKTETKQFNSHHTII